MGEETAEEVTITLKQLKEVRFTEKRDAGRKNAKPFTEVILKGIALSMPNNGMLAKGIPMKAVNLDITTIEKIIIEVGDSEQMVFQLSK